MTGVHEYVSYKSKAGYYLGLADKSGLYACRGREVIGYKRQFSKAYRGRNAAPEAGTGANLLRGYWYGF